MNLPHIPEISRPLSPSCRSPLKRTRERVLSAGRAQRDSARSANLPFRAKPVLSQYREFSQFSLSRSLLTTLRYSGSFRPSSRAEMTATSAIPTSEAKSADSRSLSTSLRSIGTQFSPPSSDIGSNHSQRESSLDGTSNEDYDMLLSKDFGRVGDSELGSESTRSRSASEASYGSGGGTRDMRLSFPDPLDDSNQHDTDHPPSATTSERAMKHRDLNSSFLSDYSFISDLSRSSSPSLRMLAEVEIDTTTPRRLSGAATSTSSSLDHHSPETVTRETVDKDEQNELYQAGEIGRWLARTSAPAKRRPTVDHAVSTSDSHHIPCSFTTPSSITPTPTGRLDIVLVGPEELLSATEAKVVGRISSIDFGRPVRLSLEKVVAHRIREAWACDTPVLVVYVEDTNLKPSPVASTDSLSASSATIIPRTEFATFEMIEARSLFTPPVDATLPPGEQVTGYIHTLDGFERLDSARLLEELSIIVKDVEMEGEVVGENETEVESSSMWNSLGRLSSLLLVSLTAVVVIAASLLDSTPSFDSISPIAQYSPAPLTSTHSSSPIQPIVINLTSTADSVALTTVASTVVSPSPIRNLVPSPASTLYAYEIINVHSLTAVRSLSTGRTRAIVRVGGETKSGKSTARSSPPRFVSNREGYVVRDLSLFRDCRAVERGCSGCRALVVKEIRRDDLAMQRDWMKAVAKVGGETMELVDSMMRQLLLIDIPTLTNLLIPDNLISRSILLLTRAEFNFHHRTRLAQAGLRTLSRDLLPSFANSFASGFEKQVARLAAVDRWIIQMDRDVREKAEKALLGGLGIKSREKIMPLLTAVGSRVVDKLVAVKENVEELYGTAYESFSSSGVERGAKLKRGVDRAGRKGKRVVGERVRKAVRGREKVLKAFRRSFATVYRSLSLPTKLSLT